MNAFFLCEKGKFLLTILKGKARINIDVDKVNVGMGFGVQSRTA